jgi:hypothetical protein
MSRPAPLIPVTVRAGRIQDPTWARAVKRAKREGVIVTTDDYGARSKILQAAVAEYAKPARRGPRS